MSQGSRIFALVMLLIGPAACEGKTETQGSKETVDAGADKPAGKVEQALASAVRAGQSPTTAATGGPPADGVMEPARAESEVPSGSAPKLTLGTEGSGPKTLLREAAATLPRSLTMEMSLQAGTEQGLPPIAVTLGLEGKKGKDADAPLHVTAKVRDIKVSMPNVPAEFTQQLAGLRGGKITFLLTRGGGGYSFASELAPGARPELRELLEAVTEGLAMLAVPTPAVPVGAGAVWMVASRENSAGFGLLSYRMVKVLSVTDTKTELEFDARRYAVGRAVDPSLLPPGSPPARLQEMAAGAKAKLTLSKASLLALTLDGDVAMRGAIDDGERPSPGAQAPGQRLVQAGTGYRIAVTK